LNDIFRLDRNIQISVLKILAKAMNIKMLDCVKKIVWVENPIFITCEISINCSEENCFSKAQEGELTKLIEKASDYGFRFINLNLLSKIKYPTDLAIKITKYHGFFLDDQIVICGMDNKIYGRIIEQNETLESKANMGYVYDAQSKINNDRP